MILIATESSSSSVAPVFVCSRINLLFTSLSVAYPTLSRARIASFIRDVICECMLPINLRCHVEMDCRLVALFYALHFHLLLR